ncbi:M57 family metalloprotease [Fructilactobacillus vespulae]|uniref:matrixin family metalloprotease n=1 Tax=Fructilactobacillus vespulae TaxID=1249630 RepID=UPI0039B61920
MKSLLKTILIITLILLGFNWYQTHPVESQTITSNLSNYVSTLLGNHSQNTTTATANDQGKRESASANETPIESIVQGTSLNKTYYYEFNKNMPQAARAAFENAIQTYNATGIVKLVPGTGTKQQNTIKFSIYNKQIQNLNQGVVELGLGGPEITKEVRFTGTTYVNHGSANLNANYPNHAFTDSVAIHELGHALGLDHSQDSTSVMYPVNQGVTQLSDGDLAALQAIYPN